MLAVKRRRTLIRIISYCTAGLVVMVGFAVSGWWVSYVYRRNIEYTYQRALVELSEHVNDIDTALQKADYTGTPEQFVELSAEIWRDSGAAKADLAQIPLLRTRLTGTYKFISQVGDYTNSISQNVAFSRKISNGDRSRLSGLRTYAKKLSGQLSGMVEEMQTGRLTIFTANNAISNLNTNSDVSLTSAEKDFSELDQDFKSMPSLIYDGPFSDSVEKKTAVFLKGKAKVSREQALARAAGFLAVSPARLHFTGATGGNLPTYNFSSGKITVSVSVAGGYVARMMDGTMVEQASITRQQAAQKAAAFLKSKGIPSMAESYYHADNNICIVNFAYRQQGVVCYPDLIKVGVSMQTGRVVSFDASGYLMNHRRRTLSAGASEAAVRKLVSPTLTIEKISRAVIPVDGGGEALCFECKCKSKDGKTVLDYYDAKNARERQLLILLRTDGGTLTI